MKTERELHALLASLTLSEKAGQMVQQGEEHLGGTGGEITGPLRHLRLEPGTTLEIGSVLGSTGAAHIRELQARHLDRSRHGIPLLFMADVIHGYRTILPVPLAQGCSFDPDLVREGARMAAAEAAAGGVQVNFSPMCDLVRDPRWGRVMETTGEDPWLNGLFAAAMTEGYQGGPGGSLRDPETLAACVKHFAAYGAAEGGRDYNTTDLSERTLRESYLPAYRRALDAGCAMVMTSFNVVDGLPATGNARLLRTILREEWGFDGVVISDWNAIGELVPHGVAETFREAARLAVLAGVDIDMMSPCYANHLAELVIAGEVPERLVDEAVLRILRLKNALGLFDDPFRQADPEREARVVFHPGHRALARKAAARSMVLLKNDGLLPFPPDGGIVAVVGPYAVERHILGGWSCLGEDADAASLPEALAERLGAHRVLAAAGCGIEGDDLDLAAVERVVSAADRVVLAVGEHPGMSGEAGSRAAIGLPGRQEALCRAVFALGKPCAVVLFNGRPLDLRSVADGAAALLEAWFPGTEGARAAADLLVGDASPRGRLTMGFPRSVGQVPIHYNHFNTGRPRTGGADDYFCSGYQDLPSDPLFPFGFGLSYTQFSYGDLRLDRPVLDPAGCLAVSVPVTNIGSRPGSELVQLYIRDLCGSVVRPVRELKGFQWVDLAPGETTEVTFAITEPMLRFHGADLRYASEPGRFLALVGSDSLHLQEKEFVLSQDRR